MKTFFQALRLFLVLTILTEILYPFGITFLSNLCFPNQANGNLIEKNGKIIGSKLIAQNFKDPKYFWPRPSAVDFGTVPSGASNFSPTNAKLKEIVLKREESFRVSNEFLQSESVPSEMLFASASGLDPHISPEAARLQVSRIVATRQLNTMQKTRLFQLIKSHTEGPQFGFFGEPRVNVLNLNLALDSL